MTTSENKNWVGIERFCMEELRGRKAYVAKTLKIGLLPALVLRSRAALVASNSMAVTFVICITDGPPVE